MKSLISNKRSPKSIIKSNMSVSKSSMDKIKNLAPSCKVNDISSLIGSIQKKNKKRKLDSDHKVSSRTKNPNKIQKQNTMLSDTNIQK